MFTSHNTHTHSYVRVHMPASAHRQMEDDDMFDYAALDVYLLPPSEEILEIAPYEEDILADIPEFGAAIREAVDRRTLGDDPLPTTYGA